MAARVPFVVRSEITGLVDHYARRWGCVNCRQVQVRLAELTGDQGVEGLLEDELLIAMGHLGRVHQDEPSTAYLVA
ncbi:hypothetical protein AB0K51_12345 [Kitasatospora sp. NPDC049285]|uniref:hypothetical protein n=1 Tax=Kitasatospora sp. NPDC049285 TaxID=3157096 RepID=UPI003443867D